MSGHDFWMQVLVHFVAIVLGGLKLAIVSAIFWYVFRKKYLVKIMGKLMQDLMQQISPPAPVPVESYVRVGEAPSPMPGGPGFGAGPEPHGLLKDHVPLSLEELRPYLVDLEEGKPTDPSRDHRDRGAAWVLLGQLRPPDPDPEGTVTVNDDFQVPSEGSAGARGGAPAGEDLAPAVLQVRADVDPG